MTTNTSVSLSFSYARTEFIVSTRKNMPKSNQTFIQHFACNKTHITSYYTLVSGVNRHSNKYAPRNIPEVQDAFKILMIHWILQFALRIAFRCVLHRCGSQDIRRWKLYGSLVYLNLQEMFGTPLFTFFRLLSLRMWEAGWLRGLQKKKLELSTQEKWKTPKNNYVIVSPGVDRVTWQPTFVKRLTTKTTP